MMKILSFVVVLSIFIINSCYGFSGTVPPVCDALANWGCNLFEDKDRNMNVTAEDEICMLVEPDGIHCRDNGDCKCRMNCIDPNAGFMNWAGSTIHAGDIYRLSTKNGESSYTPGQTVILQLETLKLGYQFRGLVLYAVRTPSPSANMSDITEEHVGSWEVTDDDIYYYVTPEDSDVSCRNSIMHLAAAEKPLVTYFRFTAPPAGTGSITFRTLIKTGNANTGQFYYANDEDLTMNEGEEKRTTLSYVRSEVGQSCSAACGEEGLSCNSDETNNIQSEEDMEEVRANVPCSYPSFAYCAASAPLGESSSDVCYYRSQDSSCTAEQSACEDVSSSDVLGRRICACGSSGFRVSSGSLGFFVALFSLSFLLSGNNKKFAMVAFIGAFVLFTAMPQQAEAHNWIFSDSRADGTASVVYPCQPQRTPKPNIQVGRNEQTFAIEWATGHGSYVYFALVAKEDELYLRQHSTRVFNDYLTEAKTASASNELHNQGNRYRKQHRYYTGNGMPDLSTSEYVTGNAAFHSDPVIANSWDPTQPDEFIPKIDNCTSRDRGNFVALRYDTAALEGDSVVVGYESANFPWIKGVWKYEIESGLSGGRMDVANFWIPSKYDAGQYIIHYFWNGYYDCVDIDHLDIPDDTTSPCGTRPGGRDEIRVDHCYFPEPDAFLGPAMKVIDHDPQPCIARCLRHDEWCAGIMFFPMRPPSPVAEKDADFFLENYAKLSITPENWPAFLRRDNEEGPNNDRPRILWNGAPNRAPFCTNTGGARREGCEYFDLHYDLYNHTARAPDFGQNLRDRLVQAYEASFNNQDEREMYCAAIRPRVKTNTKDTILTTDDPRNPAFYSTCVSVSDRVNFEFGDYGEISLASDKGPFKFLDQCLTCESRRKNTDEVATPIWEFAEECLNCELEEANVNQSTLSYTFDIVPKATMQLTHAGRRFDIAGRWDTSEGRVDNVDTGEYTDGDQRNTQGASCTRPTFANYPDLTGRCSIKLGTFEMENNQVRGAPGWTPSDTTYRYQACAYLATLDDRCDPNAIWIERSSRDRTNLEAGYSTDYGCRCYMKNEGAASCCGEWNDALVGDGNADVFTVNVAPALPTGNCTEPSQGIYSAQYGVCCDSRCQACGRNPTGGRFQENGSIDCGADVLKPALERYGDAFLCSKVGPPCLVDA